MTTLIDRLNETAEFFRRWPLYVAEPESRVVNNPAILREAVDEIERLRSALEGLFDLIDERFDLHTDEAAKAYATARKALRGETNEGNTK